MVKLLNLDRTATFAISNHNLPVLATANVAGAFDVDFSASSKLEIWSAFNKDISHDKLLKSVEIDSKLFDLTWSSDNKLLVGGLESGLVQFWDGEALLTSKDDSKNIVLYSADYHSSAVKSLAFNHTKSNILLSGSANSEILIWDTNKLTSDPLTATGESFTKPTNNTTIKKGSVDEINSLSWNHNVSHIFASASTNGITSIWDLKSKRKVLNLSYTANTNNGNIRANLTSVAWHPTQSTRLVTTSDLDSLPVICQWDLRFAKSPELIYGGPKEFNSDPRFDEGHSKGILSVDWLSQDSDFLITSGKDSDTFLWDTKTGQKLASYPSHSSTSTINAIGSNSSSDWVFKTRFAGGNPEYFANATFDGKVGLQTIQDTSSNDPDAKPIDAKVKSSKSSQPETSESDFWNKISDETGVNLEEEVKDDIKPEIYVKKAPKWLSRPVSVSFAFGGKLVCVKTVTNEDNSVSSVVEIATTKLSKSNAGIKKVEQILSGDEEKSREVIDEQSKSDDAFDWQLLKELSTFKGDKKKLLFKYIQDEKSSADKGENDSKFGSKSSSSSDDSFFNNLAEQSDDIKTEFKPYKPNGEFTLLADSDKENDSKLKKLILSGKFLESVDLCLKTEKIIEALIIALSSKNESLKQKVLGHYFKTGIDKNNDTLIRLLYSTSNLLPVVPSNDSEQAVADDKDEQDDSYSDLINNASVDNWKEIALGISTYVKDDVKFNRNITELGSRVYANGSRDNAVLLYFVGGSLNKISEIWLKELEEKEKEILKTNDVTEEIKNKSSTELYYDLLNNLVVKVLIFKNSLGISTELPNTDGYSKLNKLFLDYIKYVGDNYGNLEFVEKLLNVLPSDLEDVELGKARIGKATAKSSTVTTNKRASVVNGHGKYYNPAPSHPSTSVYGTSAPSYNTSSGYSVPPSTSNYTPMSTVYGQQPYGAKSPLITPAPLAGPPPSSIRSPKTEKKKIRPSYVPPQPVQHAPQPAFGKFGVPQQPTSNIIGGSGQVYGGFDNNIAPPPTGTSRSTAQNPSKVKKPGHEGWNDLPDAFADVTSRFAKKKPAPVNVAQPFNPAPVASPGLNSRTGSFSAPPLKKTYSSPRINNSEISTPPLVNNRYAPTNINTTAPPPINPMANAPPMGGMLSPQPIVNPYAPAAPPINSSPYSNGPPSFGSSASPAPPKSRNPYGPPPTNNAAPPVSNSYGPPLTNNHYAAPINNGQPPITGPPKKVTPAAPSKAKYPAGDRSHISSEAKPIFEILSSELELAKPKIPAKYSKKIVDTEKRLNVLFEHLNNDDLLTSPTIQLLVQLSINLNNKNFIEAHKLHLEIATDHTAETDQWLMGVKRLIDLIEACDGM